MKSVERSERDTSIELYRIIVMLLIIAHHYVVNSGLLGVDGPVFNNPLNIKSLFLVLFGAWGKTGINCFVIISSYFLCTQKTSFEKFMRLYCQVYFYKNLFIILFALIGYTEMPTLQYKNLFPFYVGTDFVSAYLFYYLLIPYVNICINQLNKRQHMVCACILIYIFIVLGTLSNCIVIFNYVEWFVCVHFIVSFIKKYPHQIYENARVWGGLTLASVSFSVISIVLCMRKFVNAGVFAPYTYVADSNTFLAFTNGLCSFLFIKNIKMRYNKFINKVASTTFGVLLIHASSDTMRQWLWKDVLNNVCMYESKFLYIHAIVSVSAVFCICSILDGLRNHFVEKPMLKLAYAVIERKNLIDKSV